MSYELLRFDGIDLPLLNPGDYVPTHDAASAFVGLVGGRWLDGYGAGIATASGTTISHRGTYVGDTPEQTTALVDALRGKILRVGLLQRQRIDSGVIHSTSARLMALRFPKSAHTNMVAIDVEATFALNDSAWNGDDHEVVEEITPNEIVYESELPLELIENTEAVNGETITITNHGNAYQPHVIATLKIGGVSALPVVGIRNYTTGHWWPVIDTATPMMPGQQVRFDSGTLTVQLLDSAGNFVRNLWNNSYNYGSHTEWFALAPGDNEIECGYGDATGNGYEATIAYSDAWH